MTIWWLLTRELINCSHVTFQKHNCKDVYAKFQLTSEEALINVSISSPKFCFLLSSDHSCYCNRRLIDEQHSTSDDFPVLTRAYDNNGRCPRQKFVFGILQLCYYR